MALPMLSQQPLCNRCEDEPSIQLQDFHRQVQFGSTSNYFKPLIISNRQLVNHFREHQLFILSVNGCIPNQNIAPCYLNSALLLTRAQQCTVYGIGCHLNTVQSRGMVSTQGLGPLYLCQHQSVSTEALQPCQHHRHLVTQYSWVRAPGNLKQLCQGTW